MAQLPTLMIPPAPTSSANTPQTLGATYWWPLTAATNVGVGNNVTNWIDVISGRIWTNGANAKAPTLSSQGVTFGLTTSVQMTNVGTSISWGDNSTHWLVLSITNNQSFKDLLDVANNGTLELGFGAAGQLITIVSSSVKTFTDAPSTNRFFDIIVVASKDALNNTAVRMYTNGIACATVSTTWAANNWNFLGGIAAEGFFRGCMKDVGVFASKCLTNATDLADLHSSLTNLYPGITP